MVQRASKSLMLQNSNALADILSDLFHLHFSFCRLPPGRAGRRVNVFAQFAAEAGTEASRCLGSDRKRSQSVPSGGVA
jgi:hypothetical protein